MNIQEETKRISAEIGSGISIFEYAEKYHPDSIIHYDFDLCCEDRDVYKTILKDLLSQATDSLPSVRQKIDDKYVQISYHIKKRKYTKKLRNDLGTVDEEIFKHVGITLEQKYGQMLYYGWNGDHYSTVVLPMALRAPIYLANVANQVSFDYDNYDYSSVSPKQITQFIKEFEDALNRRDREWLENVWCDNLTGKSYELDGTVTSVDFEKIQFGVWTMLSKRVDLRVIKIVNSVNIKKGHVEVNVTEKSTYNDLKLDKRCESICESDMVIRFLDEGPFITEVVSRETHYQEVGE